jgi:large subunit ribosomal protein L17
LVKKLFDEIAARYKDRSGGYTRVIKTGYRKGDASPIAILEFVEEEKLPNPKQKTHIKAKNLTKGKLPKISGKKVIVEQKEASSESKHAGELNLPSLNKIKKEEKKSSEMKSKDKEEKAKRENPPSDKEKA